MPKVNISEANRLPIPIAPLAEQRVIEERLADTLGLLSALADNAAEAAEKLERLEPSILAKVFRGELVPQDPADEPASTLLDRIRAEAAASPKKPKRRRRTKTADA